MVLNKSSLGFLRSFKIFGTLAAFLLIFNPVVHLDQFQMKFLVCFLFV